MRAVWIVLVLAIVGGAAWYTRDHWLGRSQDDVVDYAKITTGPLRMTVQTTGPLKPIKTVPVGSEVSGTMEWLGADYNDRVKAGQVIAKLRPELFEAEKKAADAAKQNAEASHQKAKIAREDLKRRLPMFTAMAKAARDRAVATLESVEYNWNRVDALFKKGDAPEAEWHVAKAAYEEAKAALDTATISLDQARLDETMRAQQADQDVALTKAALDQANATLYLAEQKLDRSVIKAPIDGFVLKRMVSVGEPVISALTAQYVFIITPDLSNMQLQANVSESDIALVQKGQAVTFTVDATGDRKFSGQVAVVRNDPITIQGVVTYQVMIEVENPDGVLKPDMTANVSIEVVKLEGVPKIENTALRFRPPIDDAERRALLDELKWPDVAESMRNATGRPNMWIRQNTLWSFDKGRWIPVPVLTGVTDNRETQIVAGATAGQSFATGVKRRSGVSIKKAIELANPTNRSI